MGKPYTFSKALAFYKGMKDTGKVTLVSGASLIGASKALNVEISPSDTALCSFLIGAASGAIRMFFNWYRHRDK